MQSNRQPLGFMGDPEMDLEIFLDQLIESGVLAAVDRLRVLVVRWRTRAEEDARRLGARA
jgi:hypothetical protein